MPFKYPRAGRPNAEVELGVRRPRSRRRSRDWLDRGTLAKLRVPRRRELAEARPADRARARSRSDTTLALLAFDPQTGAARTLLTEHDDAWLNVDVGAPHWLADGSGFLWMTEARGRVDARAARRPTARWSARSPTPELGLRKLVGVDGDRRDRRWPRPIRRARTSGASRSTAARRCGSPTATASPAGRDRCCKHGVVVVDVALAAGGRKTLSRSAERGAPRAAERRRAAGARADDRARDRRARRPHAPRRDHAPARVRRRARAIRCCSRSTAARTRVTVEAARDAYVMDQWYADAGFIVVRSDNRGTPNRGRAWERAILQGPDHRPARRSGRRAAGGRRAPPRARPRRASASSAGRSAATSPRWRCCSAPTCSRPRSPARRSPTGRSTTPRTPSAT